MAAFAITLSYNCQEHLLDHFLFVLHKSKLLEIRIEPLNSASKNTAPTNLTVLVNVYRHRKQTNGYQSVKKGGGISEEFEINIYTLLHVK